MTPHDQKQLLNRLKRAEGQLRGIQNMLESDQSTVDVVTQLRAVRSTVDRTMGILIAQHLQDVLTDPRDTQQDQLAQAIDLVIKK